MKCIRNFAAAGLLLAASTSHAHDGRRFEILIVDGQLVAQGYHSAGTNDGGGVVRPYYNALHDHWHNNPVVVAASADLPGFDLFTPGPLVGHSLSLTLTGSSKWVSPPMSPPAGSVPELVALDPGEVIFVSYNADTISTDSHGSFLLTSAVPSWGAPHIDLNFDIASRPAGVIYVLEFVLATNAHGVANSDTIYLLLAPAHGSPPYSLHHAALFLENCLGTAATAPCLGDIADDFGLTAGEGGGPDGQVDFGDFAALLGLIGPCHHGVGCTGDIANDFGLTAGEGGGPDGAVDFGDFAALLGLIGPC